MLEPIEDKFVFEGSRLTFILNATDPDGDPISFSAIGLPEDAILNETSGNFTWIPSYDQAGNYSIQFIVIDTKGAMDSKNVSIYVLDFNRPPKLDQSETKLLKVGNLNSRYLL
ncbi:MAG: Ig domain-containing protein [Candidatus Bathyarchaeia archaeon]